MDDRTTDEPACEYVEVVIVKAWFSWVVAALSVVPLFIVGIIPVVGSLLGDSAFELWHPARVEVRRVSDGRPVVGYSYLLLSSAGVRHDYLASRIRSDNLADLCAYLGISIEAANAPEPPRD